MDLHIILKTIFYFTNQLKQKTVRLLFFKINIKTIHNVNLPKPIHTIEKL